MGNLKDTVLELRKKLDHGDIATIALELKGNVRAADVYNILQGRCLNDPERTRQVLVATRELISNKNKQYGLDDQGSV